MTEYPKIQSLYKRSTDGKDMLYGQWSLPEFGYLANNEWQFTEKIDGTNIRVGWDYITRMVSFWGKTDNAQMPSKLLTTIGNTFTTSKFQEVFPELSLCLYGEGYGAGIQRGGIYRKDQDFILFDVKVGDLWLRRDDVEEIADKLGIFVVPVIGKGTLFDLHKWVEAGFESRSAFNVPVGLTAYAEGIVARPLVELRTRRGDRMITKLKHKDFDRLRTAEGADGR